MIVLVTTVLFICYVGCVGIAVMMDWIDSGQPPWK